MVHIHRCERAVKDEIKEACKGAEKFETSMSREEEELMKKKCIYKGSLWRITINKKAVTRTDTNSPR